MFESFQQRRVSRWGRLPAIAMGVVGTGIVLFTIYLVATPSRPPTPPRPASPAFESLSLPGMWLDVPAGARVSGDYVTGHVQHSNPLDWGVSWAEGELPQSLDPTELVIVMSRGSKTEQIKPTRLISSRDLTLDGAPARQYVFALEHDLTLDGAPARQYAFALERDRTLDLTLTTCGRRLVQLLVFGDSEIKQTVARRMASSFVCSPDPAQDLDPQALALEVRPGWYRVPATGRIALVDASGVHVLPSVAPKARGAPFRSVLERERARSGFMADPGEPQEIAGHWLWPGTLESSRAVMMAWPCPDDLRTAIVYVASSAGAPLDRGIDLALTGRCLAPDEDLPVFPAPGEPETLARAPATATPPRCAAEMVGIPAGRFQMGGASGHADERPHDVTLSGYCIDRTEVTVKAYESCVAAKVCSAPDRTANRYCELADRADHPITCVDWSQAEAYCRWAQKRLPTEAEWEYAARGGDGRVYPWGNQAPAADLSNTCERECVAMAQRERKQRWTAMYDASDGWGATAPVGSFPAGASPFGALDLAGNVWEWTADWYGSYPGASRTNPHGMRTGSLRVFRGGAWNVRSVELLRATYRNAGTPTTRDVDMGFRCARGA
jgi:formylglycine-generating enzyme required for sulfatase activity